MNMNLKNYGLDTRSFRVLVAAGCTDVASVKPLVANGHNDSLLRKQKNCGPKTVIRVQKWCDNPPHGDIDIQKEAARSPSQR